MRIAAFFILFIPALSGCKSLVQSVYDEHAEQECYDLPGIEAQRACLNDLEREQFERGRSTPKR